MTDKKQRHSWLWQKPSLGQRQCQRCGKVSTVKSHSACGECVSADKTLEEKIQKLYCKWCPKDCKGLTSEELLACLASGGFADELKADHYVEIEVGAELPANPHSKDVHLDAGVYDGLNHRAVEEYKELLADWVKKKDGV